MRVRPALGLAALLLACAWAVQPAMRAGIKIFPPLSLLPVTSLGMQDIALASCGLRAAAADLAWIQLLQYAAGSLPGFDDQPGKPYIHLKTLTLRVVRLDPSFHRAYLFGASILAWFNSVDRPDEAIEILEEGLRNDPGQPLYSEYIAAIAYKRKGDINRMVSLLESTLTDPHSPIEMKAILANLYKSRGEYAKSLAVWEAMLDNPAEAREWPRARIQVTQLRQLIKDGRKSQ